MVHKNSTFRYQLAQRINKVVIKVGTSSLTHSTGKINIEKMDQLVRQVVNIHNMGKDVVIVSSGAIAAGLGKLGFDEKPESISEKQAAAAVGQNVLMHMYSKLFSEYGITIGQILVTKEDLLDPSRIEHCSNMFNALRAHRAIPIVNENDAVSVDEIKVGDNDTLSAYVANLIESDLLIIMSDIDGLFDKNPNHHSDARLIEYLESITTTTRESAGGSDSEYGTGGMLTKIQAVEVAAEKRIPVILVNSQTPNILNQVIRGENVGTAFCIGGYHE